MPQMGLDFGCLIHQKVKNLNIWLRISTRAFIQKEPTSHLNIIFGCNITIHYLFRLIGTTIEVVLYWNQQKILKMLNCWLTELIMQMLLLSF